MSEDRADPYPSPRSDPRTYRSRSANRTAALLALTALLAIVLLVALLAS